jgi:glycosyltransferase involved in cell wall biosynthesis
LLGPGPSLDLLHVGSTIPRKRIDVVLRTLALVRVAHPEARLVRVGGVLTASQAGLARELGVADAILTLPFIDRRTLAAVYRRAALVLLPSEREGFGLPLIEALACGTPVVATALPVLQEVGADAATYAPLGDARAWCGAVVELLRERTGNPEAWIARRTRGLARAGAFSWSAYASRMTAIYERTADAATARR